MNEIIDNKKDIVVLVATHKPYTMPNDDMYIPVCVGKDSENILKERPDFASDCTGDNIADKNYSFCELTALYWGWKNVQSNYLGLAHYRRHFKGKKSRKQCKGKFKKVIDSQQLGKYLEKYNVVLPKKRHYYIETNESHYLHAHHAEGLTAMKKVISEDYPDYVPAMESVMKSRSGHRFNMYVMRRDLSDAYCAWLFDILFKVEKMIDISEWSKSEQRVFGYLAERMLDIWLERNKVEYVELPYIFMEKQNMVKKVFGFLGRKFKGKKS